MILFQKHEFLEKLKHSPLRKKIGFFPYRRHIDYWFIKWSHLNLAELQNFLTLLLILLNPNKRKNWKLFATFNNYYKNSNRASIHMISSINMRAELELVKLILNLNTTENVEKWKKSYSLIVVIFFETRTSNSNPHMKLSKIEKHYPSNTIQKHFVSFTSPKKLKKLNFRKNLEFWKRFVRVFVYPL